MLQMRKSCWVALVWGHEHYSRWMLQLIFAILVPFVNRAKMRRLCNCKLTSYDSTTLKWIRSLSPSPLCIFLHVSAITWWGEFLELKRPVVRRSSRGKVPILGVVVPRIVTRAAVFASYLALNLIFWRGKWVNGEIIYGCWPWCRWVFLRGFLLRPCVVCDFLLSLSVYVRWVSVEAIRVWYLSHGFSYVHEDRVTSRRWRSIVRSGSFFPRCPISTVWGGGRCRILSRSRHSWWLICLRLLHLELPNKVLWDSKIKYH